MTQSELSAAARNRARIAAEPERKAPAMYTPDKPCSRCGGLSRFTHNDACAICYQKRVTKLHGEID